MSGLRVVLDTQVLLRGAFARTESLTAPIYRAWRSGASFSCCRDRVRVLLQTGLRKSEFLGLRWKDVDLKAGVLTIPRSKHGETRHVPLTSAVRAIISRRPRSLDATALIFPNSLGNADLHWAEKDFPDAVEEAEIKDFRLHDTRHTFASRLAMEGVDLLATKELGG